MKHLIESLCLKLASPCGSEFGPTCPSGCVALNGKRTAHEITLADSYNPQVCCQPFNLPPTVSTRIRYQSKQSPPENASRALNTREGTSPSEDAERALFLSLLAFAHANCPADLPKKYEKRRPIWRKLSGDENIRKEASRVSSKYLVSPELAMTQPSDER